MVKRRANDARMSISIEDVSFSFGQDTIFKALSLSIELGQFCCLLGSNGSGKSTLLRLIAGELTPDDGSIHVRRDDQRNTASNMVSSVTYLPHDVKHPPYLTVRETVSMARFRPGKGLNWRLGSEDLHVVDECIAICGAEGFAERSFRQLSGGERRRAWLAFCLAQGREFLLLDEALTEIDFAAKSSLFALLKSLAAEHGKGVVLVTHDPDMALRYSDRFLVLQDGVLVYDGEPSADALSFIGEQRLTALEL